LTKEVEAVGVAVVYNDIAIGAREAFSVAGDTVFFSAPDNIKQQDLIFTQSANPCEGYDCALDGDTPMLPDRGLGGVWGFVSNAVCGADCAFDVYRLPTLTVSAPGSATYASSGIWMRFDPERGTWPTRVTVEWRRLGERIDTAEFTADGPEVIFRRVVENYTQVVFRFHAMNAPYSRLRIQAYDHGIVRTFCGGELLDISLHQQSPPLAGRFSGGRFQPTLPISTCELRMIPYDNADYLFQANQPLAVWRDDTLIFVGYPHAFEQTGRGIWQVLLEDWVGTLDGMLIPEGSYTRHSARDLVAAIAGGAVPVTFEPTLEDVRVSGTLPICTAREALAQVCFAAGWSIVTAGVASLRVYKPLWPADEIVHYDASGVIGEPRVSRNPTIHDVTVSRTGDPPGSEPVAATVSVPYQQTAAPRRDIEAAVRLTSDPSVMAKRLFEYVNTPQTLFAEVVVGAQRQDAWRSLSAGDANTEPFSHADAIRSGIYADTAWNPCGLHSAALDDPQPLWAHGPSGTFGAVSRPAGGDGGFSAPMVISLASHNGDLYTCEGVRLRFSGSAGSAVWASAVDVKWFADGEYLGSAAVFPDKADFVCRADMKRFDTVVLTFTQSAVPENRLSLELAELWGVKAPALKPGDAISLPLDDGGPYIEGRIESLRFKLQEGQFRAEAVVR
jgi:hypothetical protein